MKTSVGGDLQPIQPHGNTFVVFITTRVVIPYIQLHRCFFFFFLLVLIQGGKAEDEPSIIGTRGVIPEIRPF